MRPAVLTEGPNHAPMRGSGRTNPTGNTLVRDGKLEQAKEADAELKAQLLGARYGALASRARTEHAHSLVDHLYGAVVGEHAQEGRGQYKTTKRQVRRAVEGLTGDLLLAHSRDKAKG